MKITGIETIPIKLRMKTPFVISNVTMSDVYYVIIKTFFDNGIVGYGEATPAWEVTGETYQSVVACIQLYSNENLLGYTLVGKEINSLEDVEKIIEEIDPLFGSQMVYGNSSAKAAIEQSLLDGYGKEINKRIYEIFGGKNISIPFAKTISIYDVDKTLEEIKKAFEQKFETIRLKIGIKDFGGLKNYERDVQVIKQGKGFLNKNNGKTKLVADANQGFNNAINTIDFCKKIEGCLDWLEQPIISANLLDFQEIKKQVSTPIMADESVHSYHGAKLLLELGGADFLNIKLMKTGGMIKAVKIIDLADSFGVRCQIGSMIENTLGISMGCQTFMVRPNVVSTDLNAFGFLSENVGEGITIENNLIHFAGVPGSGITINDDLLKKYQVNPEEEIIPQK